MLLHSSEFFGSVPTLRDEDDGDEVVDYNKSGTLSPMAPLLARVSGTGRHAPIDFLPPL